MTKIDLPIDWATLSAALDRWLDADDAGRAALLAAWRREQPALEAEVREAAERLASAERRAFMVRPARAPTMTGQGGAPLPAPPTRAVAGQRCGAYRLVKPIGRGGMSEVWLAERDDGRYDGRVAVKLLRVELASHEQSARFPLEGRILARLDHPHIARLLDAGVAENGLPFWVLEHVDGLPLDRHCDEHALDLRRRLALFADVLDAVAHAHGRLILHRDLKPPNILVDRGGQVKLLDFGVAKLLDESPAASLSDSGGLTHDYGAAFTPLYAAPEQLTGGELTTATDIYALGLLLHELVTGEAPFPMAREGLLARLTAMRDEPRRASQRLASQGAADSARRAAAVRGDIDTMIAKALAFDPSARYLGAADFAEDIRRHLRREPIRARPASSARRLRLFVGRHRLAVAAAGFTATALAIAGTVALLQAREADRRRDQAEGLVAFMLNDLRESLAATGRLELLATPAERVLAHYSGEDLQSLGRDGLVNRSTALYAIGILALYRGQLESATRALEQLREAHAALAARWPGSAAAVSADARTASLEGRLAGESSRPADRERAEIALRSAARLAEAAYELEGRSDAAAALSGSVLGDLGLWLSDNHRPAQSLDELELAEARLRQASSAHPDARRDLANTISVHSDALYRLGRLEACATTAAPLRKLEIRRADGTRDLGIEQSRNGGLNRLVACLVGLGRVTEAAAVARDLAGSIQSLARLDPANTELRENSLAQRLTLVEVFALAGDKAAAEALFTDIDQELRPRLATVDGQDEGIRGRWFRNWINAAARVGLPWTSFRGPWEAFMAARARQLAGLSEDGKFGTGPPIQGGTRLLVKMRDSVGATGSALSAASEARRLRDQLAELTHAKPPPSDLRAVLARAEFAAIDGRVDEARAEADRLFALGLRHPDLVALRANLHAGRTAASRDRSRPDRGGTAGRAAT